mgnify:CR=1 FL=1
MPGIIDQAAAILSSSEKRLEAAALNLSNMGTPGFKRQIAFSTALEQCRADGCGENVELRHDFAQGRLSETGAPLDLAIFGPALFQLRDGEALVYSRGGSFTRGEGGTIADVAGRVLQQAGGGDLTVSGERIDILEDGTVLEDGLPAGRIALMEAARPGALIAAGGANFTASDGAMEEAQGSTVRQGFRESSNVVASDEMVAIMASSRQAEGGARLAQFYDRLMGQAITTFSRAGR